MSKDYNYIAAVEKAISEKYGKDTVQDFRSGWDRIKKNNTWANLRTEEESLIENIKKGCPIQLGT